MHSLKRRLRRNPLCIFGSPPDGPLWPQIEEKSVMPTRPRNTHRSGAALLPRWK